MSLFALVLLLSVAQPSKVELLYEAIALLPPDYQTVVHQKQIVIVGDDRYFATLPEFTWEDCRRVLETSIFMHAKLNKVYVRAQSRLISEAWSSYLQLGQRSPARFVVAAALGGAVMGRDEIDIAGIELSLMRSWQRQGKLEMWKSWSSAYLAQLESEVRAQIARQFY